MIARTPTVTRMRSASPPRARQRGLVLVTSLLLLVVVTILAVGMFRSFGLQEQIAGNVRDKQRALSAAQAAEQYAESYLSSGNAAGATACTTGPLSYPTVLGQVCTLTLQNQTTPIDPSLVPWKLGANELGVDYAGSTALQMNTTTNGSDYYTKPPRFYIGFISTGVSNGMITNVYQIDAVAYGANASTVAVIETTYQTQTGTKNLGEGQ